MLVGLPFQEAHRSMNLLCFHFGRIREVPTRYPKPGTGTVGEWALHVQCAWHLRAGNRIIVASNDRWAPVGDPEDVPEEFDCDVPGSTHLDFQLKTFLQEKTHGNVASVEGDPVGGFQIRFEGGQTLAVFPDNSRAIERWRLFRSESEENHFVVTRDEAGTDA